MTELLKALEGYDPDRGDGNFGFRLAKFLLSKGFQDEEIADAIGMRGVGTIGAAQYMWVRALALGRYTTPEQRAKFERDLMDEVEQVGTKPFNGDYKGGRLVRKQYELYMRENLKKLFDEPKQKVVAPFRRPAISPSRKQSILGSLENLERKAKAEKDKQIDPPF